MLGHEEALGWAAVLMWTVFTVLMIAVGVAAYAAMFAVAEWLLERDRAKRRAGRGLP